MELLSNNESDYMNTGMCVSLICSWVVLWEVDSFLLESEWAMGLKWSHLIQFRFLAPCLFEDATLNQRNP